MKNHSRKSFGFTLVELLVVVSIITFLSSVVLAQSITTKKKARDTERLRDLREIQKAIELYRNDNGSYPNTGGVFFAGGAACGEGSVTLSKGYGTTGYVPGIVPTYIPILAEDPAPASGARCFVYKSDGSDYMLADHNGLEYTNPNNPTHPLDRPSSADASIAVYTSGAAAW